MNPVVLVLSLRGDTGARRLLNAHRDQLAIVPLARADHWDVPPSTSKSSD
jgi:hypothetical protein